LTDDITVIDASVAVKAVLPNHLQGSCRTLVLTFSEVQPAAPALWANETTSAIAKAVHFGEITEKEGRQALEQINLLNVYLFAPDVDQNRAAFDWALRLKRGSTYDSYYLVLALALECGLWTADRRLFNSLKDSRLSWLHWIEELEPLNG
jgi:predicted nucleic acid-binding protein